MTKTLGKNPACPDFVSGCEGGAHCVCKPGWGHNVRKRITLRVPAKQIRASIISAHVRQSGLRGAVVFTCGNAATALRRYGCFDYVLEIGPRGTLNPLRWHTPAEINKAWPDLFDATSGHLPLPLMVEIAYGLQAYIGALDPAIDYLVPTGSGETIICLRLAYPEIKFIAVYDSSRPETTQDQQAPLNRAVYALFPIEYKTEYQEQYT